METDARPAISLSASVGKEIRKLLIDLDMKQTELAALLGENEMWVSRRLLGRQPIDLNDLDRIAKALDVALAIVRPDREGRVVTHIGATRRQDTVAKLGLPKKTRPATTTGPSSATTRIASTRRLSRLIPAAA